MGRPAVKVVEEKVGALFGHKYHSLIGVAQTRSDYVVNSS